MRKRIATAVGMVAEDDKVVTYKTFSGTHQGEFAGIPPSNMEVTIDVIDIFRVEDGDCREELWFLLRPT